MVISRAIRQVCAGLKEGTVTCQGKWPTDQNGEHIFFHNTNHKVINFLCYIYTHNYKR